MDSHTLYVRVSSPQQLAESTTIEEDVDEGVEEYKIELYIQPCNPREEATGKSPVCKVSQQNEGEPESKGPT